jgi:nucleoside-diphosphate-sugar epimerase
MEAGHDVLGIDSSRAFIELARERAPRASFRVGSFADANLPEDCDAVLAIGEVLGSRSALIALPRTGSRTTGRNTSSA